MPTSDAQARRRAIEANGHEAAAAHAADEAEVSLASLIGQHVALNLAQVLGQMLGQVASQPGCVLCVADRKKVEAALADVLDGEDAEARDQAAAALPQVQQAMTWEPLGAPGQPAAVLPVCYGHFHLPPDIRPVGLVDASGNAIMARGA